MTKRRSKLPISRLQPLDVCSKDETLSSCLITRRSSKLPRESFVFSLPPLSLSFASFLSPSFCILLRFFFSYTLVDLSWYIFSLLLRMAATT